jgi:hypothetical protein
MSRLMLVLLALIPLSAWSSETVWVDVPGVTGRVPVAVTEHGEFSPLQIPSVTQTPLRLQWVSSPVFSGQTNDEVCTQVGYEVDLLRSMAYPDLMRRRARERLRTLSIIRFSAPTSNFFTTPQFMLRVREALAAQGRSAPYLALSPKFQIQRIEPRVRWSETAWSRVVGSADALADQALRGLSQGAGAIGLGAGEFSGADFYCDLISGRAEIVIEIEGAEMGGTVRKELLSSEALTDLMRTLRSRMAMLDARPEERERNRTFAAFLVGRTIESELNATDFEAVLNAVLDSESGLPRPWVPEEGIVETRVENIPFSSQIRWVVE